MTLTKVINQVIGKSNQWALWNGDAIELVAALPDNSVHLWVTSPPFESLYIYSDSERDMGNCANSEEFAQHLRFLASEMLRATVPGRLVCLHCKDLPTYIGSSGAAGLYDFPSALRATFEAVNGGDANKDRWVYHGRTTIWKCPVTEMQRTNNHGLLYSELLTNSCVSRPGMADYMIFLRKWSPGYGLRDFLEPVRHTRDEIPLETWQKWASPVWDDIQQTNVLNTALARTEKDSKHICLAERSLVLTKERGYVPIETVKVGEHALTHKGRWRKILVAENTGIRETITVKAHGVAGLRLTPDHKIWARASTSRPTATGMEPDWKQAQETAGMYINMKLPEVKEDKNDNCFWWTVGRWLACGSWGTKNDLYLCSGREKVSETGAGLGRHAGKTWHDTVTAMQIRLRDPDGKLRSVLSQCGRTAKNKSLPPCAFTLSAEHSKSLLDGYLAGDGHNVPSRNRWTATSISKSLMYGMAVLAQRAYGAIASVYAGRPDRDCIIQGRTVHANQEWIMSFDVPSADRTHKPFILEDGAWKKVRSITQSGECTTWNLRVDEDESFVAENCIVKNCPLQLGVIDRCITLYSNPGDIVADPFTGIGSVGYQALKRGRRFVGTELKPEYFRQAVRFMEEADSTAGMDLFSMADAV